jgi:VanZ family protein
MAMADVGGDMREWSFDGRWTAAVAATVGLVVAAVVPSPFERRPEWERVGPDKLLHFVGHAVYAFVLANALDPDREYPGRAAAGALCLSTAHSLLSGRLQERVPGRANERGDVAWAVAGSALAACSWRREDASETTRERPAGERASAGPHTRARDSFPNGRNHSD